jgi:hypothetical protein
VKVYGVIAGYDVLGPEAKTFVNHCQEAEVEGRFLIWNGQIHDFPLTAHYRMPEAMKAVNWTVEALEEGRREADNKAGERKSEQVMPTQLQSHSGRDTYTLEKEASNLRQNRNMRATETSPKAHRQIHLI